MPKPIVRDGELSEKPPQHETHKRRIADALANHESGIDMYSPDVDDIERMRRHYYAKVTTVDEQLGKVMAALEERVYLENSLLVFCSDHGELLGDHTLAYKWLMYDQVTNVPMIICDRRAGSAAQGESQDLMSLMDVGPTLLEAAGIEMPTRLVGRSLEAYLKGGANHTPGLCVLRGQFPDHDAQYDAQTRVLHRPGSGGVVRSAGRSRRAIQSLGGWRSIRTCRGN